MYANACIRHYLHNPSNMSELNSITPFLCWANIIIIIIRFLSFRPSPSNFPFNLRTAPAIIQCHCHLQFTSKSESARPILAKFVYGVLILTFITSGRKSIKATTEPAPMRKGCCLHKKTLLAPTKLDESTKALMRECCFFLFLSLVILCSVRPFWLPISITYIALLEPRRINHTKRRIYMIGAMARQ